jgi:ribosome biogenesis GTPase
MEIGMMSRIKRGKHTTRHVELIKISDESFVIDTPGFSVIDMDMEPEDAQKYYPEFKEASALCGFRTACI